MTSTAARLDLADGACWNIVAENPGANDLVEKLMDVMQLSSPIGTGRHILVRVQNSNDPGCEEAHPAQPLQLLFIQAMADYPWDEECSYLKNSISCILYQEDEKAPDPLLLMQFSSLFVLDAVTRGGLLLHGALIERDGMGIILAGPGGIGKTTACSRLPETWRTLSDDATLIVRDNSGDYWAHPWPTWSRFLEEQDGGSWDVGKAVAVKAICFLYQSPELELIPLGEGEKVCMGLESIEQASRILTRALDQENSRKLWEIYFRNICQMAKTVPGYRINLDRESPFWECFNDF
jgi:SynChlorMet cassette protein ScmC